MYVNFFPKFPIKFKYNWLLYLALTKPIQSQVELQFIKQFEIGVKIFSGLKYRACKYGLFYKAESEWTLHSSICIQNFEFVMRGAIQK